MEKLSSKEIRNITEEWCKERDLRACRFFNDLTKEDELGYEPEYYSKEEVIDTLNGILEWYHSLI